MNSLIEENYLKALFSYANEQGEVSVKDLSEKLDIKMPTVTSMMKKLSSKGLVNYQSYKPLKLTAKGRKEAGIVIRKHRLTEMYLVEKMGFGWENVHEIAEQMEHIKSPDLFDRMDKLLDHPKHDPHGSPIPDKDGKIDWVNFPKLSECTVGQTVRFAAVVNSSAEFLSFLNKRQLKLGTEMKLKSIEPFDNSMIVSYGNKSKETLSLTVSEKLLVEVL
jgi:DtxR family transcriptional regulator, Mn-dependent transcriptional regulator